MNKISRPTVRLLWCTPDPARVVAVAARMTYSRTPVSQLTDALSVGEITRSVNAILERRHLSVLRHVVFCFSVEGVSRALSHQLVRHTAGHSYEQRSQHYRTEVDPEYIEPETINEGSFADHLYGAAMESAENSYHLLMENGIPKEDARMVLPNAVETQLIWTANLEAILNFVQTRACRVNCSEIIHVAAQVRKIVVGEFPMMRSHLGPTCFTRGVCYEGDKFYSTCGKPWRSPTILWRPDFPRKMEVINTAGKLGDYNLKDDRMDLDYQEDVP
jgi:thymidylate synthase (FAD)